MSLADHDDLYPLPDRYKEQLDKEAYNEVLRHAFTNIEALGHEVVHTDDGDIMVKTDTGEEGHFYLDNLIVKLVNLDRADWLKEIERHFYHLRSRNDAYTYLFKDYEYARQFLKVMVKPKDFVADLNEWVSKEDFPNTCTFLIFDFEGQFYYINKEQSREWELSEAQMFEDALLNISQEEIEIKEYLFAEKYTVMIFFSGDFSASFLSDPRNYEQMAYGRYGNLIAIPAKGTAFLHPIEGNDVTDTILAIYPVVEKFYKEDAGNISLNLYWYYEGKYEMFPENSLPDGKVEILLPQRLIELLKEDEGN